MKYLKLFESLENTHEICKKYDITNYTINSDGSIDVDDDVNLQVRKLTKLPLKFRNVSSIFYCSDNYLTNLKGSPIHVDGYFYCNNNYLTSLEGSPTYLGANFYCNNNYLKSLESSPTYVGGIFNCSNNSITSLEGAPTYVGGYFNCSYNNITSLEGVPLHIGGNFYCDFNPVFEIWKLFQDKSKIELFNDYDIIRGTDIVLDRLNDFLITIGGKPVKSVIGYNNI